MLDNDLVEDKSLPSGDFADLQCRQFEQRSVYFDCKTPGSSTCLRMVEESVEKEVLRKL